MDKEIHEIQASILKELLFRELSHFSELNREKIPSDQFAFHLKQLVDQGIAEKTEEGLYRLTVKGKEYANRFDVDSGPAKIEKQAKLSALVIAIRDGKEGTEYLMQTRSKHPFFGFRGFHNGKNKNRRIGSGDGRTGTP